jgi:hypothetical protein
MTKNEMAYRLAVNALNLYSCALTASNGRNAQTRVYRQLNDVKPGDYVVEQSSAFMWMRGDVKTRDNVRLKQSMGKLLKVANEDGQEIYYIRNLLGIKFRWHNCKFIKIADHLNFYEDIK